MLYQQVREYITGLSDTDLLEYVLTGRRMYDAEAVAFAKAELERRNLSPELVATVKGDIQPKLAGQDLQDSAHCVRDIKCAVVCQQCGVEAPVQHVQYHQNIGMVFMRIGRSYDGFYCRKCNRQIFWEATLLTAFLGWWGLISFFLTPGILLANLVGYLKTRTLPPVPDGATPPSVGMPDIQKVAGYSSLIDERMADGVDPHDIARELAPLVGITPGQAWCCIRSVLSQRLPQAYETSRGFPVMPSRTMGSTHNSPPPLPSIPRKSS